MAESVREVVSCDKLNKVLSVSSSSYTAPTALDIKQELEQIRANVFYSTFVNVLSFVFTPSFFTFLRFFNFFLERFFYIYG